MKRLNGNEMKMVLFGFMTAIVLACVQAKGDFTFGEPVNLGPPVNTSQSWSGEPAISADDLELYFTSQRSGGQGAEDIWVTTRPTKYAPWGEPENLGPVVNSSAKERGPCITADGLELYFASKISGKWYIYVSTRPTKNGQWSAPVKIPNNPRFGVDSASVSGDGLELYYSFYYNTSWYDIHVMKRETTNDPWPAGVPLGPNVNHERNNYQNNDMSPCISYDGSALFYALGSGKVVDYELLMSTRTSTEDPWMPCIKLDAINSSGWDFAPCVSADGSMLYFESDRPSSIGGADIWQAPIIPIVDFNSDEKVDMKDVVILTEHWGESDSVCDIGPMPWGDGVVDVQDLIVLTEHIEPIDHTLIAHWAFDEMDGMSAIDSAGDNDAVVVGGAEWLPDGGQVDGALKLNGVDGCVVAEHVLNPADGPFSILAWINGGAPGQVILSQINNANWLYFDSSEGRLMSDIQAAGRSGPLLSQAIITDGQWHRIGFVWDGSKRMLYVDGVIVAEDTQDGLTSSYGGLYIGCGKNMEAGTYFSGLIDDIRIYNRAVAP